MTIRLATARRSSNPFVSRSLAAPRFSAPANDNRRVGATPAQLRAALLHFARYGLSAADKASQAALRAWREGDAVAMREWLEVCRTLDPRRAAPLEALLAPQPTSL